MPSCLRPRWEAARPKEGLLGDHLSTLINVLGNVSPPCWCGPIRIYALSTLACNFTVILMSDPFRYLVNK